MTRSAELPEELELAERALLELEAQRAGLRSSLHDLLHVRLVQIENDISAADIGIDALRRRVAELRAEAVAIADAKRREASE